MAVEDTFQIREFERSDYEELARLEKTAHPDRNITAEALKHGDEKRADKCKHQRYIAELDGDIIGHALYTQWEGNYQPGKFRIDVMVHPEYQGEGYGSRLYRHLMKDLKEHDPVKLVTYAREDKDRSIRFLRDRGFEDFMREWISELDVAEFDFDEYEEPEESLKEEGVEIVSLADIDNNEQNKKKLYELHEEVREDVPMHDDHTKIKYERYIERVFDNPGFFPEAFILAIKDGEFIGMSSNKKEGEDSIYTVLTGVKQGYRRRGIATTMKVKAIEKAKEHGISTIRTSNETGNEGIVHLNEKLGFEKRPAYISFKKELG